MVKIKLLFVVISRIGARTKLNLELVPELTKLELARTKIKIHLNLELVLLKLLRIGTTIEIMTALNYNFDSETKNLAVKKK